ncbi:g8161 [Coccomyxa elongata]
MAYFSSFSHTCLQRYTSLNVSCTIKQHRAVSRRRRASTHTKSSNSFRHIEGSKHKSRALATVHAIAATSELPAELKKIVDLFNMVPDPKLKYQQLLAYGKKLPPMPAEDHTDDNKVRGCVSQVWVKPELRDGKVYWQADSDSVLTKGLAALLVQGLSGSTLQEVASLSPDWISEMGLQQSLTPSRNNGFLNMFALMRQKAAELSHAQQGKGESASAGPSSEEVDTSATNGSNAGKQSGSTPDGSRKPVYEILKEELAGPVHALSLDTKSPQEVQ